MSLSIIKYWKNSETKMFSSFLMFSQNYATLMYIIRLGHERMNLQKLQFENQELKRKLQIAQAWMKNEVRNQVKNIWLMQTAKGSQHTEITEEHIAEKITDFIWEVLMLNVPNDFMENIISAEILFHSLEQNNNFDWLWIISSYHKALDVLIENFITKGFRKFAHKQWQTILRKNDVIEKTLNSVVNQWYILWVGRLYHIIKMIKQSEELWDYGECFKQYLEKYDLVWNTLLEQNFYDCFTVLVNSEILGRKRHVWKINFTETAQARKLLIWDFDNQECLIYKLIETQKIEY